MELLLTLNNTSMLIFRPVGSRKKMDRELLIELNMKLVKVCIPAFLAFVDSVVVAK
jgi:hypothetical protein